MIAREQATAARTGFIAREALARGLMGAPAGWDARAVLLGTRVDTRHLPGFADPETLRLGGTGAAFVFRYGVLVTFGASAEVEARLIDDLRAYVSEPSATAEFETARVEIDATGAEHVNADGHIHLREGSIERLLLTATVLARSVVLARDEGRVAEAFDGIEPLVVELERHGRAAFKIRRLMKHIGAVLSTQHRVLGSAQISEKPELLWERPDLERLYARLEAEFELVDRSRAIERKLGALAAAADVLLNLVQDKRSHRLELAVIALIALEVVVGLFSLVH